MHDPNISVVSASLYLAKTFAIFESPTQQNKVCYVRITLFIVGNKICNIRSHAQSRPVQFEKTRRGVGRRQPTYRLVFSNCISIGSTFYGLDNQVVWREGQDIGMWICVVILYPIQVYAGFGIIVWLVGPFLASPFIGGKSFCPVPLTASRTPPVKLCACWKT